MLKPISLLVLAAVLVFAGCRSRQANPPQFITITDASKEQFFTVTRLGQNKVPASVQLRIIGRIEGPSTLIVLFDGQPNQSIALTAGAIDTEWQGDLHSNQVRLHYLPGAAKSGALQIACQFSD